MHFKLLAPVCMVIVTEFFWGWEWYKTSCLSFLFHCNVYCFILFVRQFPTFHIFHDWILHCINYWEFIFSVYFISFFMGTSMMVIYCHQFHLSHAPSNEPSFPIVSVGFSSIDKAEKWLVVWICWSWLVPQCRCFSWSFQVFISILIYSFCRLISITTILVSVKI